jgi:hypothetical protein
MTSNLKPDLRVQFCGIELRNPVIAASGTFGYGVEFEDIDWRICDQGSFKRADGRQSATANY